MTRALLALAMIGGVLACASGPARAQEPAFQGVPPINARVRVIVPTLGPGWRTGWFNRTRQEPPCYLVLMFDPGPVRRIAVTADIGAVTRMQLSSLHPGTGPIDPDPGAGALEGERWQEVTLDAVRAATGRGCPESIRRE